MQSNFQIIKPSGISPIPIVAHVPHSSRVIPAEIRRQIMLDEQTLERELVMMTDAYTDILFSRIVELGGVGFINKYSRLVVDPERFPDDTCEVMAARGMGAVYRLTSKQLFLRDPSQYEEIRRDLLERYFHPYAKALEEIVEGQLLSFGKCLIVDCHSFSSIPLPHELNQKPNRPEICIGSDSFHTPSFILTEIADFLKENGISFAINHPFSGSYVPLKYYQANSAVSSVMIEIRRDLYMIESSGKLTKRYEWIKEYVDALLERLVEAFLAGGK